MITVSGLSVSFTRYEAGLRQSRLHVVTDLDLEVNAGEIVAVVGSSGSGKSLLAHAILGLLPANAEVSGSMLFNGAPLTRERQLRARGKEIALVPQSIGFLDPLMRAGAQVRRAGVLSGLTERDAATAQARVFDRYALPAGSASLYPFALSGGMARRTLVSTAAIGRASLIIADEPTHGLHPELVQEALSHMRQLADDGRGVILITHDIEEALRVADRVAVFYAGTTVEQAHVSDFSAGRLRHPYTQALWRALPGRDFVPVDGSQPTPDALPTGCLFAPRCALCTEACTVARPHMRALNGGRVRCVHA